MKKRVKLFAHVKEADASAGIGLEDVKNTNIHTPATESTH